MLNTLLLIDLLISEIFLQKNPKTNPPKNPNLQWNVKEVCYIYMATFRKGLGPWGSHVDLPLVTVTCFKKSILKNPRLKIIIIIKVSMYSLIKNILKISKGKQVINYYK